MNTKDKIEFMEWLFDKQLSWISSADGKVSTYFALETAMIGVLAAITPSRNALQCYPGLLLFGSYILLLSSLAFLAIVVFPRVRGPEGSMVYFGGIASRSAEQFAKESGQLDDEKILSDLVSQVHRNAQIANIKYKWIRRSAMTMYLAVIPWVLSIILLFGKK